MKYKVINKDGSKENVYRSKFELLTSIKESFEDNFREGVSHLINDNSFLRGCCHHWGEVYFYYDHLFDCESGKYIFKRRAISKELMIIDEYGRIVNLPDLAKAALRIKLPEKKESYGFYYPHNRYQWWEDSLWWTKYHERNKNANWVSYNGSKGKRLQQERRISCDKMHQPFVRGRRTKEALDPWGMAGGQVETQITWKQMKIKKQYMEKVLDK